MNIINWWVQKIQEVLWRGVINARGIGLKLLWTKNIINDNNAWGSNTRYMKLWSNLKFKLKIKRCEQPTRHYQQMGIKMKKKLQSTFHSIDLFGIICSTDYKKVWGTIPDQPFRSKPLTDHNLSHLETKLNGEYGGRLGDDKTFKKKECPAWTISISVYFLNEKLLIILNAFGF